MRRSHPTAFVLKKRDSCAVCNNIAPCPACPKGQQCQQIFRSSCQDCPVNRCVAIPGYHDNSTNPSAIGGGIAALLIVAAAGVAFWFWRRLKAKRRRIALHDDAMERREKVRSEKEATTLQLGGKSIDTNSPFAIVDDDELDNDTEYTQVTGVLQGEDALGSLAEPTAFRRRSFGAATHLSRITEGVEEEEEDELDNGKSNGKRNTIGSLQSSSRSFAGPRISVGSGTSLGSHNIIPIAFKPPPTASATPAGQSPSDDDGYESISPLALPSTAHRATGAPALQINAARQGPVRPTRAPDLNLRLPETRPHKPTTSSPLADKQPEYEFMSIDPVEALKSSGPYSRSFTDRPLSGATINTIGSTHSGSLSYVLSAPQVITPVSGDGVRRVQLGSGGKAQLVKVPSLKRKPVEGKENDPFRDPGEGEGEDLIPPPTNRFGSSGGERSSTISTSTLGIPFGENPFGPFNGPPPDQTSPSDAVERTSWLGTTPISPGGATGARQDPFDDTHSIAGGSTDTDPPRASIGGLSLLGQFPFDFAGSEQEALPQDASARVGQFK